MEEYGLILHKDWANERMIYWEYKFVSRDDLRPPGGESLPCVKGSRQPLSQPCGWQPLAAARSRRGSDMPPAYHSLPRRHFVTPYTGEPLGVPTGEMKFGIKGVAAVGDAEPSAACGGCSEAEHPQRSKKSSKRTARRFFRAPQGGRDCDWPRRTRNPGRRERAWDCGWPKRWANRQKIYVDFTKYGISP